MLKTGVISDPWRSLTVVKSAAYNGNKRFAVYHPDDYFPLIVAAPTALAALMTAADHFGYHVNDPAFHDQAGVQRL